MQKVLAFGTFDLLHKGHEFLLNKAKKLGHLTVVLARDKTILEIKKKKPINNEKTRLKNMRTLKIANKVILGQIKDKYNIIKKENPDIICLGYDQKFFTNKLKLELKKRNIKAKIKYINSFKPEKYKSSILRLKYHSKVESRK